MARVLVDSEVEEIRYNLNEIIEGKMSHNKKSPHKATLDIVTLAKMSAHAQNCAKTILLIIDGVY
jgi:hypothetical protein